jgi:hypothetical protein
MGKRAWKCWVIASILAATLWAAGSAKAEEKAEPKAFNSGVAFNVYAVVGEEDQLVGRTPSERPLTVPPCQWWYVAPLPPVDMEKVRQEVEAHGIPGLGLWDATDADLEHLNGLTGLKVLDLDDSQVTDAGLEILKRLTALQYLDLARTQVTDAGLEYLKGLTALQRLHLAGTKVTDAGLEHLKGLRALQRLHLWGTQVTHAGVEQLKKSLPNVNVTR